VAGAFLRAQQLAPLGQEGDRRSGRPAPMKSKGLNKSDFVVERPDIERYLYAATSLCFQQQVVLTERLSNNQFAGLLQRLTACDWKQAPRKRFEVGGVAPDGRRNFDQIGEAVAQAVEGEPTGLRPRMSKLVWSFCSGNLSRAHQ
jgi:hypothetical protein